MCFFVVFFFQGSPIGDVFVGGGPGDVFFPFKGFLLRQYECKDQ